ncbi:MAG: LysR family transcriptional regulator [Rhodospirillaceae bacterium]|nr:LysR family transcriptional regulator [Rhodospirillaceae bacterium]MDD9915721.1 LysR family transcriptional regulator [Rhodospirillaceae bacterium]MDD9926132.1 LysR family transcriptional regulator [Rhodospirillaceae bacterium]
MHEIDIRNLDLNLLRVLHVLLEERNVSRAADRLALSQSATSHALGRIREYFDDPILARTAQGMQPTSRATAMAPAVARILSDIASLSGRDDFRPETEEGLVRITALPLITVHVLPRLFKLLSKQAPGLRVECRQWSASTLQEIERGQIDFAIGTRAQCTHDNLLVEPFLTERYSCAMRRGHPATKKRFTRAAFEAWPHLMIDSALPQTGPINATLESLGVRRAVNYSTQHLLTAHLALEQSDLIAIVADTIAQLYTRSADIITRKPPVDVGELSLFLASHPRHRSAPLHVWLRERLHDVAEQDPKWHR